MTCDFLSVYAAVTLGRNALGLRLRRACALGSGRVRPVPGVHGRDKARPSPSPGRDGARPSLQTVLTLFVCNPHDLLW